VRCHDDPEPPLSLDGRFLHKALKLREPSGVVFNPLARFVQHQQEPLLPFRFGLALFHVAQNGIDQERDIVQLAALGLLEGLIHVVSIAEHVRCHFGSGRIEMRAIKRQVLLDVGPGLFRPR
jgi:hypothetical protein